MNTMLNYLWGGKKEKPENENPELAMREALDEKADFNIADDGTMSLDDFIVFRCIVERQALRHNYEKNEELKKKSVELFEKNPVAQEYAMNFQEIFKSAAEAGKHMTTQACDWIDFDMKNFHQTMSKFAKEEEKANMEKINEKMQEVHTAWRNEKFKFEKDAAAAMEAFQWKCQMEIEMHKKVMLQKYMTPPQIIHGYVRLEAQKIADGMFLKFGFGQDELSVAIDTLKLHEDKKFKMLQEMSKKQKISEEEKFIKQCVPQEEMKAEYLKKGRAFGKPEFKSDQTMTFDYFLQTKLYSLEHCVKQMQAVFDQMMKERRELKAQLKDKENKEAYNLALIRKVAMKTIAERSFDATLYQELKVPEKVYAKSLQMYMMDPEKRKQFEEETEKIREQNRTYQPKEMDKEQILKCTAALEKFKFDAQVKMYSIVRMQQMPPEMINTVIMFEKEQADDQFFEDTGYQEEDVDHNIKRLKLEKDEEYIKLTTEWSEKSQKFLAERQAEAQAHAQKMQQKRAAMQKAKQEASSIETTPAQEQINMDADMNALLM